MTTEQIETIRNALAPKYEFPYYALIRVQPTHGPTFHIPAPFFNGSDRNPRSVWAGNLPIATDRRDGRYYTCPFCGETRYYAGVCQDCRREIDGELPIEYRNHEAIKKAVKEELLYRLDNRIPDLGIISAEIVLPIPPSNVCGENHSPFLKCEDWTAQRSLNYIDRVIRSHVRHQEREEYEKVIREYVPADGIPVDYIEGDVIEVEGSEELRRHINGVWQHKHPEDGYDYWHPMGRVHKEDR